MSPAPSGLQEVDGLNHLLGNPRPARRFDRLCTSRSPRRSHCPNCSRTTLWPQVSPPELFLQMLKFCQQRMRRLPFQPLPQPTDRPLRRDRYKQMHVVLGHVPLHNLHLVLRTDIPDQVPYPRCHLATQRWPSILRYPHPMQMDLEYGMRGASVICHPTSLICGARAEAVA